MPASIKKPVLLPITSIGIQETRRVFNNSRGYPLTRFGIRWILQKHVREAATQIPSLKRKRLHPHSWRHSTAVHLVRSGVDLGTIANLLGHASVNTTNKYATLDLEAKRDALSKTKPILPRIRRFGSWRSDQSLIQWLESLYASIMWSKRGRKPAPAAVIATFTAHY